MKTPLFFFALLLAGPTAVHAQKISAAQVPAAVKTTFAARFPTVKTTAWSKEPQPVRQEYDYETHGDFKAREAFLAPEVYEATFQLNGQKMSVVLTPAGLIQETETDLSTSKLPDAVRATLARDFAAYRLQEAATILKADGTTVYEAEIAQAGTKKDVLFTADGQLAPQ